jgi:hypothetical protein
MGKKIFLKTAIIILSSIKYNKFKNHLLYKKKCIIIHYHLHWPHHYNACKLIKINNDVIKELIFNHLPG